MGDQQHPKYRLSANGLPVPATNNHGLTITGGRSPNDTTQKQPDRERITWVGAPGATFGRTVWAKPPSTRNDESIFFNPPIEIRDMIYRQLIRSGGLEILRVCQRMKEEASVFIYEEGICRLIIPRDFPSESPSSKYVRNHEALIHDKIQNVDIRTKLGDEKYGTKARELKAMFSDSAVSRKNCWLRFESDCLRWDKGWGWLDEFLLGFQGFQNIFLNIHLEYAHIYHPKDRRLTKAAADFSSWYGRLGNVCQTVGPSTFEDSADPKTRYWVVHPPRQQRVVHTPRQQHMVLTPREQRLVRILHQQRVARIPRQQRVARYRLRGRTPR